MQIIPPKNKDDPLKLILKSAFILFFCFSILEVSKLAVAIYWVLSWPSELRDIPLGFPLIKEKAPEIATATPSINKTSFKEKSLNLTMIIPTNTKIILHITQIKYI